MTAYWKRGWTLKAKQSSHHFAQPIKTFVIYLKFYILYEFYLVLASKVYSNIVTCYQPSVFIPSTPHQLSDLLSASIAFPSVCTGANDLLWITWARVLFFPRLRRSGTGWIMKISCCVLIIPCCKRSGTLEKTHFSVLCLCLCLTQKFIHKRVFFCFKTLMNVLSVFLASISFWISQPREYYRQIG